MDYVNECPRKYSEILLCVYVCKHMWYDWILSDTLEHYKIITYMGNGGITDIETCLFCK